MCYFGSKYFVAKEFQVFHSIGIVSFHESTGNHKFIWKTSVCALTTHSNLLTTLPPKKGDIVLVKPGLLHFLVSQHVWETTVKVFWEAFAIWQFFAFLVFWLIISHEYWIYFKRDDTKMLNGGIITGGNYYISI